jgi:hypothetical protein
MPHPARPSIHAKNPKGAKRDGPRSIPDFSRKPKPTLKGKPPATSAKPGRRGK